MENNLNYTLIKKIIKLKLTIKDHLYQIHNIQYTYKKYHIAFGVDKNFINHLCITIRSIINHTHTDSLNFHIITNKKKINIINKLFFLISGTIHNIYIYQIPDIFFNKLPTTHFFTKAIYYRLLAPYLISNESIILYLDSDIICLNSFNNFYNSILNSKKIAFVVSEEKNLEPILAKNINLKGLKYFNSGMILINIKKWLKEDISNKTILILKSKGDKLKYMDQDALNIILENKIKFVNKKYNFIIMLNNKKNNFTNISLINAIFLHYAGIDKPWQKWNIQKITKFYTNIYYNSPWLSYNLDLPKNNIQTKKMYKIMFYKKKYLSFIFWYLFYLKFFYNDIFNKILNIFNHKNHKKL